MDETAWEKRYKREKEARRAAERIAEEKTRELFYRNQELSKLAEGLEGLVKARTTELEKKNSILESHRDKLRKQREMLRDANRTLEEKAAELEKVSRYKSDFLANVSHELRTPLNSLMILSSILLEDADSSLPADDHQSLKIIYSNANELLEIIEDILDMSRAEAGEMNIFKEDIRLADVEMAIREQFDPVAAEKKITFNTICAPDLPEWIYTDKKRLKQILKNLLSNAFKFTPEGGEIQLLIHKSIWSSDGDFTSEALVFEVNDTGIGIPEEKQKTIFQMFRQADGGTSRKYGGTGLGLAISRKLAHLIDGEIELESTEGKGSCFRVYLPPETLVVSNNLKQRLDENNEFFLAEDVVAERQFENETILLVDDDLRNSFALSRLLEKQGLKVSLAENGVQAMAILEEDESIDLLILDLMMPAMDGVETLEALRSRVEFRMLPVIVLTASCLAEDEQRCRAAGADDYLTKPVQVSVLIDRLKRWLAA